MTHSTGLRKIIMSRPRLAVFEGKGQPLPFLDKLDRDETLSSLSPEQYVSVFYTLQIWRGLYESHACAININRRPDKRVPTWSQWSGSPWVDHQASHFRTEAFKRLGFVHVTMMLHLALPPGWHLQPSNSDEALTMLRYGYWKNETQWVPPETLNGNTVWIEKS